MKVTLYFINWNDSFYLPFIAKNYSFCKDIVMFDNYSTDESQEIARSLGFHVKTFGVRGQLNDQHYLDVKNNCWKGNNSDYVIVCDADEFLCTNEEELSFFSKHGVTMPNTKGYNMISGSLPIKDLKELNEGTEDDNYSKAVIFNPSSITDINYVHGCHKNNATGHIKRSGNRSIPLYHYRMIGGVQKLIERHEEYLLRMSNFNKKFNMGFHYAHSHDAKKEEWNYLKSKAKKLW